MKKLVLSLFALATVFSCSNDDNSGGLGNSNLTLNITGLEDLGKDYVYEGWIMVNGTPISSGKFTVNSSGQLSQTSFPIAASRLNAATAFVLTIEPAIGDKPEPTKVRILAGDFSGKTGELSVKHSAALQSDFTSITGKYVLATPTDTDSTNEDSGVWFVSENKAGLSLPTLPEGWIYEGWTVINGKPISTGTFKDPAMADSNAATSPYKGLANNGPAFPGEDFLMNAPTGFTFPTSLRSQRIVVSIEPVPDNSKAPFLLKPLVHTVPADAATHTTLNMVRDLSSLPKGTFSR